MKTRSVKSSQVSALSTVTGGADGASDVRSKGSRHGPRLPRSSQARQRRAAIDRESDRALGGIRTIEKEGHRCDIGHGREAFRVAQADRGGNRLEAQLASRKLDRMGSCRGAAKGFEPLGLRMFCGVALLRRILLRAAIGF